MVPRLSGLNCPSCGAALEIRSFSHALNIVCPNCLCVLDAKDPNLQVLQQAREREKIPPLIPLGSRGKLSGIEYEVIGFQVRWVSEDGGEFTWQEYLLFNPFHGFRYLTEYNGHWNNVRTLAALPEPVFGSRVRAGGKIFKQFSTCVAATSYVVGEFPWQVRVGETAQATDYVAPPFVLSSETTNDEVVWSMGEYMTGAEVWKAFALPAMPPPTYGVFENQPSPPGVGGLWKFAFEFLAIAFFIAMLMGVIAADKQIYSSSYDLTTPSAMTAPFEVRGNPNNLQIRIHNRDTAMVYVHFALINQANERPQAEFGREVERDNTATVPNVPPGRYYLRMDTDRAAAHFDLQVRRGVPSYTFFGIAVVLLLLPPILATWKRMNFERQRWMESS